MGDKNYSANSRTLFIKKSGRQVSVGGEGHLDEDATRARDFAGEWPSRVSKWAWFLFYEDLLTYVLDL